MGMKRLLIIFILLSSSLFSCSGNKSQESNSDRNTEEIEQVSKDAEKTAEELENEADQLENDVDSLLTDI